MMILIFVLFFLVNILTLKNGHNWGDDFAQYILHAINLVEHKPYASDISYDLRILCPPGFPIILSSVIFWSGINFKILKSLNVFLWALSALAAYSLALPWLDVFWARMITIWLLTSPFFFFFKQNILSDIPFMCFVLLSIWTFTKSEEYEKKALNNSSWIYFGISLFFMSYSFLTRWAGISLFLAAILYFCVVKNDWKRSLIVIFAGMLSWLIALKTGALAMGFADRTTTSLLQDILLISWNNLSLTFQTILGLFISDVSFFSKIITPSSFIYINCLAGFFLLGIIGVLAYQLFQKRISFMGCFTLLYLTAIILWPVNAGTRYLLPLMIPLTIYFIAALKPASKKLTIFIFIFLICQNIFVIASNFKFNDDDIFNKQTLEMFEWVNTHITPKDNYMFGRPRALALFTHRVGHNFGNYPQDVANWYKRLGPLHINYLIVNKSFDQFSKFDHFHLHVGKDDFNVDAVWKNGLYKIYFLTTVR